MHLFYQYKMEYAVDMVGFKQMGGDYILKEIAIIPLNHSGDPIVCLFKKPFPWHRLSAELQAENNWLKYNYHGISWNADGLDYSQIGHLLRQSFHDANKILVIDELKKKWLQRFHLPVNNIQQYNYQSKSSVKCVTICTNHNPMYKTNCALHNVHLMKLFYQSKK